MLTGWNTTKITNGFKYTVYQTIVLETPNTNGRYAESVILQTGTRETRAQAVGIAKRWMRYYRRAA